MLKKIRKYCDRFKNCEGCELKTANPQGVRVCIFNVPPCGWLDSEIEKVNEVLKEKVEKKSRQTSATSWDQRRIKLGMTTDEVLKIIEDGRIVSIAVRGNDEDDIKTNQENIEALVTVIKIIYKYQQIVDIYYHQSGEALENSLRVVIEDGI